MRRHIDMSGRVLFLSLFALACNVHAARPFVTDDARIVDPGGYQIETFVKRQHRFGEHEFWFLPAMNAGGRVELTSATSIRWACAYSSNPCA